MVSQRRYCTLQLTIHRLITASCLLTFLGKTAVSPPLVSALSAWNPKVTKRFSRSRSRQHQGSDCAWQLGHQQHRHSAKRKICLGSHNQSQPNFLGAKTSHCPYERTVPLSARQAFSFGATLTCRGGATTLHAASSTDQGGDSKDTNSKNDRTPSAESPKTTTKYSKDIASYYLLWSPGSWRKILTSILSISVLHLLLLRTVPQFQQLPFFSFFFQKNHESPLCPDHNIDNGHVTTNFIVKLLNFVTIPLLSSACCAIQLIINAVAGLGCAGFNTYLGPLRPHFLSILMYSTTVAFPFGDKTWPSLKKWVITFMTSWFIALMPEMVHVWNNVLSRPFFTVEGDNGSTLSKKATLELDIPSMGCVACINKINSSIRQQIPSSSHVNIMDATSWLTRGDSGESGASKKGGRAKVLLSASSEQEIQDAVKVIVDSIQKSGFFCTVDKLTVM